MDFFRKLFKTGYRQTCTQDDNDVQGLGAPIPTCMVKGCVEERLITREKSGVYMQNFCEEHLNMFKKGEIVTQLCDHPACMVSIVNSPKKYCIIHQPDLDF